jgi:hypothetical protein
MSSINTIIQNPVVMDELALGISNLGTWTPIPFATGVKTLQVGIGTGAPVFKPSLCSYQLYKNGNFRKLVAYGGNTILNFTAPSDATAFQQIKATIQYNASYILNAEDLPAGSSLNYVYNSQLISVIALSSVCVGLAPLYITNQSTCGIGYGSSNMCFPGQAVLTTDVSVILPSNIEWSVV